MDSTWQPDQVTIFDFTKMLGAEGMEIINQEVLMLAKDIGFLDLKQLMSDTTAQEAKIPYLTAVGKHLWEMMTTLLPKIKSLSTQDLLPTKISFVFRCQSEIYGFDRGGYSKNNIKVMVSTIPM